MGATERTSARQYRASGARAVASRAEAGRVTYLMKSLTSFAHDANVPEGYRTEAVRLELLHNLEMMESRFSVLRAV